MLAASVTGATGAEDHRPAPPRKTPDAPSRRALVFQQGFPAQHVERLRPQLHFEARGPSLVEPHPGYLGQQVDAAGRQPELIDRSGTREICLRDSMGGERRPEADERADRAGRVGWRGPDEHIEIARRPDDPMRR